MAGDTALTALSWSHSVPQPPFSDAEWLLVVFPAATTDGKSAEVPAVPRQGIWRDDVHLVHEKEWTCGRGLCHGAALWRPPFAFWYLCPEGYDKDCGRGHCHCKHSSGGPEAANADAQMEPPKGQCGVCWSGTFQRGPGFNGCANGVSRVHPMFRPRPSI